MGNKRRTFSPPLISCWCFPLATPTWNWRLRATDVVLPPRSALWASGEEWRGGMRDKWKIFTWQLCLTLYSSPIIMPSGILVCQHIREKLMLISLFNYPNIFLNTCSVVKNFLRIFQLIPSGIPSVQPYDQVIILSSCFQRLCLLFYFLFLLQERSLP